MASGGVPPDSFSISTGSLPNGLVLNPSTGAITGVPTGAGTLNYTAKVTDSSGISATDTASVSCSISIAPSPLTLSCTSHTAEIGLAYSSGLVASGGIGPYTYSIVSGSLPKGLTLNASTGAITGTPTSEGTFNFTAKAVDADGTVVTVNCVIVVTTCGTQLTPVTTTVDEKNNNGEVAWFNSHLTKLGGTIPKSTFHVYLSGGTITFGPNTLSVPDAVITFSSTATSATTSFDVALNRWETTVPLSSCDQADEVFATGLAYLIPSNFPSNVENVTWHEDISSDATGLQVSWQYGVSNWMASNWGVTFPELSKSPFVPDYNGLMVNPEYSGSNWGWGSGGSGDQAGTPEFKDRNELLTGGGCGQGGSNWTGTWSSTPPNVNVCNPSSPSGSGGSGGNSCGNGGSSQGSGSSWGW